MRILAIHDGHNSGAALFVDGKVVSAVCEERLTRNKNELGYPKLSIEECLSIADVAPEEITQVVYASNFMHSAEHLAKASEWYKAGLADQVRDSQRSSAYLQAVFDQRRQERLQQVRQHLAIDEKEVSFVDHHLAHGAAAYFGSGFDLSKPTLILTCDGAGDGLSATVSIGNGSEIERIASTSRRASLGKVYSRVTYMLGLKPWEHEYKVMGLAPYADPKYSREIAEILKLHLGLSDDGLSFELRSELESSYIYEFLRDSFEAKRFDAIAGGVQIFTEEILTEWVENAVRATGITQVVCGGGVFMNVKANKRISEIPEITKLFVFPSCGDESLSFGAGWLEHYRLSKKLGNSSEHEPLNGLYLGREYSDAEIEKAIKLADVNATGCKWKRVDSIEDITAQLLADNNIVARFSGPMEWGARALGNRSILANPKEWPNVEKINAMIKKRDFWMPFAPSMLSEASERYLYNPKRLESPYMMIGFDTKDTAPEIGAAVHPRDKTARAQLVSKELNPGYWALISEFEHLTGTACVLNTSFNLHGFPLVNSPQDALYVFLHSGLDHLAIGNFLVSKPTE